ncbi:MAG: hypothetical protein WA199_09825, partial [Xanthobacteraceae bacterium]
ANVTTRSRFGRGARHRTIRLREPPASGALRLPALHRGFFAQAAGRLGLKTALAPITRRCCRAMAFTERDLIRGM